MKKFFDYVLNNTENRNSNSQLIATTHKVYLLDIKDIFRKDEIWFNPYPVFSFSMTETNRSKLFYIQ
jgi:AAA15 family ATPase/GTPase